MTNEMIKNVNQFIELTGGKSVTKWSDAYYAASKIARDTVRRFLIVHVELNKKGLDATRVVDRIMSDSASIDGVVSEVMNLIFEGVNTIDLFANIRLSVIGWFNKYWDVEFDWAYAK